MESGREEVTVVNRVTGEASKLEGRWTVFDACHQAQGGGGCLSNFRYGLSRQGTKALIPTDQQL